MPVMQQPEAWQNLESLSTEQWALYCKLLMYVDPNFPLETLLAQFDMPMRKDPMDAIPKLGHYVITINENKNVHVSVEPIPGCIRLSIVGPSFIQNAANLTPDEARRLAHGLIVSAEQVHHPGCRLIEKIPVCGSCGKAV